MANKSVFAATHGKLLPQTDAWNHEGAPAYAMTPRHKLAQLVMTGCLNGTFYATAREQLDEILDACREVEPEFITSAAIYARQNGYMKDTPALLVAVLSQTDSSHFAHAFSQTIDNGKMLRNFVQIMRSGVVGRKSMGSRPKRLIQAWLNNATDSQLIRASVGQSPSLADVIKMVHPKPKDASRGNLYRYFIGKEYRIEMLPQALQDFEAFKSGASKTVPDVPFQMLTSLDLGQKDWVQIARNAGWQMLRMNLNTFTRHGVFKAFGMTKLIASRLCDEAEIRKARVFPYQLMAAHHMVGQDVPNRVREALHDAMEIAVANVPRIEGNVVICPDVSGSMSGPITGYRQGSTSAVRCIDVAGLVSAAILRRNREAVVLPFERGVVDLTLSGRDTVMTNARLLASIGGGGTNCSAPLTRLNAEGAEVDAVIYISDYESWIDSGAGYRHDGARGTQMLAEWEKLKRRNPNAKMICMDLCPYKTMQAQNREDILNVGGFSDAVFGVMAAFIEGNSGPDFWVQEIEKTKGQ